MTTFTETGNIRFGKKVVSATVVVADTIDLVLQGDVGSCTHVFMGVQQFDGPDPESDTLIVAGAGTYAVTIKTQNTELFEAPPTASIDATAPVTISVAANLSAIKFVPTGITTATHYRVVVTANRN